MTHHQPFPAIKLPDQTELTLFLIKEELKSRKLFDILCNAGFDDCFYRTNLDPLIMKNTGLDDNSDEAFDLYNRIMEKRSHKIEPTESSIAKQAFKAYTELAALSSELLTKSRQR